MLNIADDNREKETYRFVYCPANCRTCSMFEWIIKCLQICVSNQFTNKIIKFVLKKTAKNQIETFRIHNEYIIFLEICTQIVSFLQIGFKQTVL